MVVLVVDSSLLIIEKWQTILREVDKIKAIYGAVSHHDGLRSLREISPDVVLLEAEVDRDEWMYLTKQIKEKDPGISVIVMAQDSENKRLQQQSIASGADYLFDKYYDFEKIPDVINNLEIKKR